MRYGRRPVSPGIDSTTKSEILPQPFKSDHNCAEQADQHQPSAKAVEKQKK
jgi:hypothetical protein